MGCCFWVAPPAHRLRMQARRKALQRGVLPEQLRHGNRRNRGGGHEVLYGGQLMAEHLLLADYELSDGDTLHFAVKRPQASGSPAEAGPKPEEGSGA